MSLGAVVDRYRRSEARPLDAVDRALARIGEVNRTLDAVAGTRFVAAREEAARVAARLREGDTESLFERAPLLGVPCAVDRALAVRGLPQGKGLASADAAVVRRLQDAGAIVVGVVAGWEGAAALVESEAVPFAIGSGPALAPGRGAWGHVPSLGRVPATGRAERAPVGPIARSVADLWAVLRVIAGPDGIDSDCTAALEDGDLEEVDWTRVEVCAHPGSDVQRAAAVHKSALALGGLGARVRTITDRSGSWFRRSPPIRVSGGLAICAEGAPSSGPVTALPVDTDRRGVPVSVQLVGSEGADRLTLAAARALERVFGMAQYTWNEPVAV